MIFLLTFAGMRGEEELGHMRRAGWDMVKE